MIQRTLTGTNRKKTKRSGFRSRMLQTEEEKLLILDVMKKRYYLVK
uniref:Large ribosomal subunit protein bL34c n=1 Tax=Cyanidium caldarium TaxID=2771 RepID=RK34_CYACA|nr:ribosomal protein L34 [Cyanidium caldarium]O19912.1 RecName: Full=Large ribosomal subunit protein bL34c; AltName: Full=50S ribosomal protein L34, chloroplastic [Cyanidium caldarium]AAB82677.1 unknown [Cyanidium caldarium]